MIGHGANSLGGFEPWRGRAQGLVKNLNNSPVTPPPAESAWSLTQAVVQASRKSALREGVCVLSFLHWRPCTFGIEMESLTEPEACHFGWANRPMSAQDRSVFNAGVTGTSDHSQLLHMFWGFESRAWCSCSLPAYQWAIFLAPWTFFEKRWIETGFKSWFCYFSSWVTMFEQSDICKACFYVCKWKSGSL